MKPIPYTKSQTNMIRQTFELLSKSPGASPAAMLAEVNAFPNAVFYNLLPPETSVMVAKPIRGQVADASSPLPEELRFSTMETSQYKGGGVGDHVVVGNCKWRWENKRLLMKWSATLPGGTVDTYPFTTSGALRFWDNPVEMYRKYGSIYLSGMSTSNLSFLASDTISFPPKFYNREHANFLGLPVGTIIPFANGGEAKIVGRTAGPWLDTMLGDGSTIPVLAGAFELEPTGKLGENALEILCNRHPHNLWAKSLTSGSPRYYCSQAIYSDNSGYRPLMHKAKVPLVLEGDINDGFPFKIRPLWLSPDLVLTGNFLSEVEAFLMG